jgi:putative intracellular protease/amidase
MSSVLFVITAADRWTLKDGSAHPTGYWGEEVAEPHRIFSEAGWQITIATPGGVPPTLDRASVRLPTKVNRRARRYLREIDAELRVPRRLDEVDHADFDVVFYPGGHGPMEDLAYDETSGRLLTDRLESGRPLALLCHAPAAILAAKHPDGSSPFAGRRLTGLTNLEERTNPASRKAKWLLEDRLREIGTDYVHGRVPLRTFVVRDRNLYTGQNPASSARLAERLIADHVDGVGM